MALVGVLSVVLIVALISLTALDRARLQIRTVTAAADRAQALEAAEFALREAARHAEPWSRPALRPVPAPRRSAWGPVLVAEGRRLAVPDSLDGPSPPVRVLIERLRPVGDADCPEGGCGYRITAFAGRRGDRRPGVMLQAQTMEGLPRRTWRVLQ
jgi:hypothetical protein